MKTIVSSIAWVRRGVAKETPDKVELSKEQLEKLIQETKGQLDDAESGEEDSHDDGAVENKADDNQDELAEYDLDNYDDDDTEMGADGVSLPDALASLSMYADEADDPYITIKEEDEDEAEDFHIKPTDNLVLVGKAEEECSNLEVYVYNEIDDVLYCHHDIILPAFPLALEWLNFDPGEETPGNFVAVGSMTPGIDIWDLDLVDCVEPIATLGSHKVKKKKKSKVKKVGHTDSVLDLSWNHHVKNVLASASADATVALWDLTQGKPVTTLKQHTDKVQTLQWHPFEAQSLLTGGFDKCVKVFDCRSPDDTHKQWKFNGEIERVLWNQFSPFYFLASTDKGFVYYVDVRSDSTVFTLQAHSDAVTGLSLSSQVPGCLVTTSADHSLKVWDIQDNKPECIVSKEMKMGILNCISSCPDSAFVMATGGEKEGLRVLDLMSYAAVERHFAKREKMVVETDVLTSSGAEMGDSEDVTKETDSMETDSVDTTQSDSNITGGTKKKKKKKKH